MGFVSEVSVQSANIGQNVVKGAKSGLDLKSLLSSQKSKLEAASEIPIDTPSAFEKARKSVGEKVQEAQQFRNGLTDKVSGVVEEGKSAVTEGISEISNSEYVAQMSGMYKEAMKWCDGISMPDWSSLLGADALSDLMKKVLSTGNSSLLQKLTDCAENLSPDVIMGMAKESASVALSGDVNMYKTLVDGVGAGNIADGIGDISNLIGNMENTAENVQAVKSLSSKFVDDEKYLIQSDALGEYRPIDTSKVSSLASGGRDYVGTLIPDDQISIATTLPFS